MRVLDLHGWDIGTTEAGILQRDLATRVVRSRCLSASPRYVAGADLSVDRVRGRGRAAVVVLSYPDLQTVEVRTAAGELYWPYVPGFLSFREAPLVLAACRELDITPDLLIVDGQGVAHPRGLGLASHLGLFLDIATIGCAKSLLCGVHGALDEGRGASADVVYAGEVVAAALRTRDGVGPVYVSIGHKVDLASAVEWVLHCTGRYRLPEPTRLAHLVAGGRLS
jgi:deoxyribonuclease V